MYKIKLLIFSRTGFDSAVLDRWKKKKEERNGISKRTQQDLNPIPDMSDVYKDKFNIQKIDHT